MKDAYNRQKAQAARRGIEWLFTFESWIAFWGADLPKRGRGHDKLSMQRLGDLGPYSPDNCRKDYPKKNAIVAGANRYKRNRESARAGPKDWGPVYEVYKATHG